MICSVIRQCAQQLSCCRQGVFLVIPADVLAETRWGLGVEQLDDMPTQNIEPFLFVSGDLIELYSWIGLSLEQLMLTYLLNIVAILGIAIVRSPTSTKSPT